MRTKRRTLIALGLTMALGVLTTACGMDADRAVDDDTVMCIYGKGGKDGTGLKDPSPVLPGTRTHVRTDADRPIVRIPVSNRFYEISKDWSTKDAGAATHIEGFAARVVPVEVQIKAHFVFNAARACDWMDAHGKRNSPGGVYSQEIPPREIWEQVGYNPQARASVELPALDMGFNVRQGIVTPWLGWLNENMGEVMDDVVQPILRQYEWDVMHFNDLVEYTGSNPDIGEPGEMVPMHRILEEEISIAFTNGLNRRIGDVENDSHFFCGIGHDQSRPDSCPPIVIQILDVTPGNGQLVADRTAVAETEEANRLALDQQAVNNRFEEDQLDQREAEVERQEREAELADRESAQAIADAERAAAQQAAIEAAKIQADVDAGLYEQRIREAEIAGAESVAPCTASGVTGIDCVYLILALNGGELPDSLGGTFVVPQSGSGG